MCFVCFGPVAVVIAVSVFLCVIPNNVCFIAVTEMEREKQDPASGSVSFELVKLSVLA